MESGQHRHLGPGPAPARLVIALLGLLVVLSAIVPPLVVSIARTQDGHALAGRLGSGERERRIRTACAAMTEQAEQCLRLGDLRTELGGHAWRGTPCTVQPLDRHWAIWRFATGDEWVVRQPSRRCRHHRKVIVQHTDFRGGGLAVAAYVPGVESFVVEISDARPR